MRLLQRIAVFGGGSNREGRDETAGMSELETMWERANAAGAGRFGQAGGGDTNGIVKAFLHGFAFVQAVKETGSEGVARTGGAHDRFLRDAHAPLIEDAVIASGGDGAFGEMNDDPLAHAGIQKMAGCRLKLDGVDSLVGANLQAGGAASLELVQDGAIGIFQRRANDRRKTVAVFADDIDAGLETRVAGLLEKSRRDCPVVGIGLVEAIEQ
jgi:hypothetical protein